MCGLLFKLKGKAGISLTELMVAAAILTAAVPAGIRVYWYASRSIQESKYRTVATNLAQEQVQTLKSTVAYLLPVTTTTVTDVDIPTIVYDKYYYPLQTLQESGIAFQRATRVDYAIQNGTVVSTQSYVNGDTGLKKIVVYVKWHQNNEWKVVQFSNLIASQATNPLNDSFTGTVTDTSGNLIAGALVQVLENSSWKAITGNSGGYTINVASGLYTLQCSSAGFYPSQTNGYVSPPLTQNFQLTPIASAMVTSEVYLSTHVVISQVVVSTGIGNNEEYIELYNPTTAPILMYGGMLPLPKCSFRYWDGAFVQLNPALTFKTSPSWLPATSYYLIANTNKVHAGGAETLSDASYVGKKLLINAPAGIAWYGKSGGAGPVQDSMAWGGGSCPAALKEGSCISSNLAAGQAFIRSTHPGGVDVNYGRAYDSDDNIKDFSLGAIPVSTPPNNSTISQQPITGSPAVGTDIAINDPLSTVVTAVNTIVGGYRVSQFNVLVATGTWRMEAQLNGFYALIDNIPVTVATGVPNGYTSPAGVGLGEGRSLLGSTTTLAFVAGYVQDILGNPIPGIQVNASDRVVRTNNNGRYWLPVSTGNVEVTVNPSNFYPTYMSTSTTVAASLVGNLYDNTVYPSLNFQLAQAGQLRAYFQTAFYSPLPGRVATAYTSNIFGYTQAAQAVSDNSGIAYFNFLATGTYTIVPSTYSDEVVEPSVPPVLTLTPVTLVINTTFTISAHAVGQIQGQVTYNGGPIKTGVLIVASLGPVQTTIKASSPQAQQCDSTSTGADACYYMTTSDWNGHYALPVPFSSAPPYRVWGYYTTFNGDTPSVSVKTVNAVNVTNLAPVGSASFSWP